MLSELQIGTCCRIVVGDDRLELEAAKAKSSSTRTVYLVTNQAYVWGAGAYVHTTTRMCVELLEEVIARRPGASLCDLGTGTGILAIFAGKVGRARACGTDINQAILDAAMANATLNDVNLDLYLAGDFPLSKQFDIVVCNIRDIVVRDMLKSGEIVSRLRPGGELVLSGMLLENVSVIQEALLEAMKDLEFVEFKVGATETEEWAAILCKHIL